MVIGLGYLEQHLKKYPLMQIEDKIKLIMQSILGPSHLINDKEKVKTRIINEYNEIFRNLREDCEPKPTQSEVGEKCGITQRKLSFIEQGKTEPNLQDLKALCLYYGVSADYILGLPKNLKYPER